MVLLLQCDSLFAQFYAMIALLVREHGKISCQDGQTFFEVNPEGDQGQACTVVLPDYFESAAHTYR